jgi:hypothetical protein
LIIKLVFSLGAVDDGDNNDCLPSDSYIMSPLIDTNATNLGNLFSFSSCSLDSIKLTLLTADKAK